MTDPIIPAADLAAMQPDHIDCCCEVCRLLRYVRHLEAELKCWRPLTPEEAERAFAEAKAEPMSEERIKEIVERALDPAECIDNFSTMQMAARIAELESLVASQAERILAQAELLARKAEGQG